jgi:hypothetical protein
MVITNVDFNNITLTMGQQDAALLAKLLERLVYGNDIRPFVAASEACSEFEMSLIATDGLAAAMSFSRTVSRAVGDITKIIKARIEGMIGDELDGEEDEDEGEDDDTPKVPVN